MTMEEMRNGERLKMRHWLTNAIDSGEFNGVEWTDKDNGKFRVPWKHASRHGWDIDRDASIFKMWAVYTGKYSSETKQMSEKKKRSLAKHWKANFRCALNALQDIKVLTAEGKSRGRDAFKVFQLLPQKKSKSKVTKMRSSSTGGMDSKEQDIKQELRRASSLPVPNTYEEPDDISKIAAMIKQEQDNVSNSLLSFGHPYSYQRHFFPIPNDSLVIDEDDSMSVLQQQQQQPPITHTNEEYGSSDGQDSDSGASSFSSDMDLDTASQLVELLSTNALQENILNETSERRAVLTQPINFHAGFVLGPEILRNDPNLYNAHEAYDNLNMISFMR